MRPRGTRSKKALEPYARWVVWESFAAVRPDLTVRAGTTLRSNRVGRQLRIDPADFRAYLNREGA